MENTRAGMRGIRRGAENAIALLTCQDETAKDTGGFRETVLSALETAKLLTRVPMGGIWEIIFRMTFSEPLPTELKGTI